MHSCSARPSLLRARARHRGRWRVRTDRGRSPRARGRAPSAALLTLALGGAIYAWCVWTSRPSAAAPAPIDAPKRLVVRGLYRATRKPDVRGRPRGDRRLGALGFPRALSCRLRRARRGGVPHVRRGYEEHALQRAFGAEYDAYCARVPRWLPGRTRLREGRETARRGLSAVVPRRDRAFPVLPIGSWAGSRRPKSARGVCWMGT